MQGQQRDFLLQLATERAFAPLWGTGIVFELDYVLAKLDDKRGRCNSAAYRKSLFANMERAFPGATIKASKDRGYSYELHDPGDGHVAHAAIIGKADAIVTDDSRAGFSTAPELIQAQIEIVSAQQFAAITVAAHPAEGLAIQEMSAPLKSPLRSPGQILDDLRKRYGMTEVAEIIWPLFTPAGP